MMDLFSGANAVHDKVLEDLTNVGYHTLHDDISRETVQPLINQIIWDNMLGVKTKMIISINSVGGDINQANHLIELMRSSKVPIVTYAIGEMASAAFDIWLAGHERYIARDTVVLSHQFSIMRNGLSVEKQADLMASQKAHKLLSDIRIRNYSEFMGFDNKTISKKFLKESDVYLSSQELVEMGVCEFASFAKVFELMQDNNRIMVEEAARIEAANATTPDEDSDPEA